MDLFVRILEVIFPVIAVVLVGFWAGRKNKPEMMVANRLNMSGWQVVPRFRSLPVV